MGDKGEFIVWYNWNGYYDCTDVVVQRRAQDFPQPYGRILEGGARWLRIDHCQFTRVQRTGHCSDAFPDPEHCLNNCGLPLEDGGHGSGVNIVPLTMPDRVHGIPNIPAICKDLTAPVSLPARHPTSMVCYCAEPRLRSSTEDEFETTMDPTNPIFYSTCYKRRIGLEFVDFDPPLYSPDRSFMFWGKCVGCDIVASNARVGVKGDYLAGGPQTVIPGVFTPTWSLSSTCMDCDQAPGATPLLPGDAARNVWGPGKSDRTCGFTQRRSNEPFIQNPNFLRDVAAGTSDLGRSTRPECDEAACAKLIWTPGQPAKWTNVVYSRTHCQALAARDPDCSDALIFFEQRFTWTTQKHRDFWKQQKEMHAGFHCVCVKKDFGNGCCTGCSETEGRGSTLYRLQAASLFQNASDSAEDQRGVRSVGGDESQLQRAVSIGQDASGDVGLQGTEVNDDNLDVDPGLEGALEDDEHEHVKLDADLTEVGSGAYHTDDVGNSCDGAELIEWTRISQERARAALPVVAAVHEEQLASRHSRLRADSGRRANLRAEHSLWQFNVQSELRELDDPVEVHELGTQSVEPQNDIAVDEL